MTSEQGKRAPARSKKRRRKFLRELGKNRIVIAVLSRLAIWYLTLVYKTNRFVVEPEDIVSQLEPQQPLIVGVWHGQHILLPAIPIDLHGTAMISRNLDGEVTARIVEHFGNRTIRASGGRKQRSMLEKGGMTGFLEMLEVLDGGENVLQTVDIPKGVSRKAGLGIVMLAQRSGRPVLPLAVASSRRYVFKGAWDRAALNLPFGTTAICVGSPIQVDRDADTEKLELSRSVLENEMQRVTARAYELCGKPE